MLDGVEGHDFFEEIERGVASVGIWEGGETCPTGPGDDRSQEDTDKDGTLDVIHHEKDCQETKARPRISNRQ